MVMLIFLATSHNKSEAYGKILYGYLQFCFVFFSAVEGRGQNRTGGFCRSIGIFWRIHAWFSPQYILCHFRQVLQGIQGKTVISAVGESKPYKVRPFICSNRSIAIGTFSSFLIAICKRLPTLLLYCY